MAKNSMSISMEVKGLDEAVRKLKVYDSQSRQSIEKAIAKAGRNVRDGAKSRTPFRTGKLRNSISSRFNGNALTATVKADGRKAPHAHLIEYGAEATTVKPKKKRFMKIDSGDRVTYAIRPINIPKRHAQPFMRPAFKAEEPKVESEIAKILRTMP